MMLRGASYRPRATCCHGYRTGSRSLVDDALDLAAVNVEFAGYGSLAAASAVPRSHRLLQGLELAEVQIMLRGWRLARPGLRVSWGSAR